MLKTQLAEVANEVRRPMVLVVDDELAIRNAIARSLRREGFDVVMAENGNEALQVADNECLDMAIIDRQMPGIDGLMVVRALKLSHGPRIHTMVLSGLREQAQRLEAFHAGADDFVPKPFSPAEVVERLHAAQRTQQALSTLAESRAHADRLRVYAAEASALLAHDLNNGLAIAMGNLDYLAAMEHDDEDMSDSISASLRALRRMAGLVSNFTDIGRLEDGVLDPRPTLCSVAELLATVASIHAPATGFGPATSVACASNLLGWFDPSLVERIIHNLLGNAMRYVDERGVVRLRAWREESGDAGAAAGWLIIEVENSGPEIPEETQRRIFAKYGIGQDSRSVRGMGLYFCRLACEAHGGTISVESTDLTTFTVRLPMPMASA